MAYTFPIMVSVFQAEDAARKRVEKRQHGAGVSGAATATITSASEEQKLKDGPSEETPKPDEPPKPLSLSSQPLKPSVEM